LKNGSNHLLKLPRQAVVLPQWVEYSKRKLGKWVFTSNFWKKMLFKFAGSYVKIAKINQSFLSLFVFNIISWRALFCALKFILQPKKKSSCGELSAIVTWRIFLSSFCSIKIEYLVNSRILLRGMYRNPRGHQVSAPSVRVSLIISVWY
jgi:hypothetical protein